MSITTANDFTLERTRRSKGFFGRLAASIVEARKRQADRVVAGYLLGLDDKTLAQLGYDRRSLEGRDPSGYPFL